jgi:signal transduction histidine kinase
LKSLYFRVWLSIVALLALFALVSTLLFKREVDTQRRQVVATATTERLQAMGGLIENALPPASASEQEQASAVRDWSRRLRVPLALDDAKGQRIEATRSFARRTSRADADGPGAGPVPMGEPLAIKLSDGRTLWLVRPPLPPELRGDESVGRMSLRRLLPVAPGTGLVMLLGLLFVGVAAGAYPVVRRLTRRLENLKVGVERFGSGALSHRVDDQGQDEVAALARSFNHSAQRVEALIRSNRSLLANASHELRSPLARMKMAVSMLDEDTKPDQRARLKQEIHKNIAELDALVDEVLVASRLDAQPEVERREPINLVAIVAEEAARAGAEMSTQLSNEPGVLGDDKLIRRAVRNLLENARRYAGDGGVEAQVVGGQGAQINRVEVRVCDRGPGVPEAFVERIFEPFFRLPHHAERDGGTGLGLSLVQQIAKQHGGHAQCTPRQGGGSVFTLSLPVAAPASPWPTTK